MTGSQQKKSATGLLEGLNQEQKIAVTHKNGPLLIVAGAGTGKTSVITRRIAWLLEQGLARPNEILALTFTEKAAAEMEERVDKLLPLGYLDLWISTFHAFGRRTLDSHGIEIGLPGDFKLLTETELWILVHENLEKFDLDYYRPLGNPSRFIHALIKHFSRTKDELITPTEYMEYARAQELNSDSDIGLRRKKAPKKAGEDEEADGYNEAKRVMEVASAYAVYQKLLLDNNALDYGDLIQCTYELFRKRTAVLNRYRQQFKYILIDEFQDTNYAQYQLVKLLAQGHDNITVVGDDDQSIYKFRGASVSNILKFKDHFKGAEQVTLTRNYRSFQNILDTSYKFIKLNSPDRLEDKLKISKKLRADRPGSGDIKLFTFADFHEEADQVVKKIEAIKAADAEASWNDFAILVRANDAAEPFADCLESRQIPYMHLSRKGLYRKGIVSLVLAYFRLLGNFYDSRALFRILHMPQFPFSADDSAKILDFTRRKTYSIYESIKQPELAKALSLEGQKAAADLLALLDKHSGEAKSRPVNELFVQIVHDLGIAKNLPENTQEQLTSLSYLDQLNRKIKDFLVTSPRKHLADFMDHVEMELAAGELGSLEFDPDVGPEALKIITVHSAKGLEFKYVFLPAMADKKFPAISRPEPIELPEKLIKDILPSGDFHIQEERRLFYVAMTRARDGLYFSYAKDYGGSTVRKPSQFIKDLGLAYEEAAPTGRVEFVALPRNHARPVFTPPRSFSFTALTTFERCPLEYKYAYILKVPEPGSAPLSFGQTIHRALENYFKLYQQELGAQQGDLFSAAETKKAVKLPSQERLLQFYRDAWVDDWFETKKQKEDFREKGKRLLKICYEKFLAEQPKPKYIERNFKLGLDKYLITGKIDRADGTTGGLVLIDYKTGEHIPAKLDKAKRRQLLLYQWAAQDFLREKVADLQYWYFDDSVVVRNFMGDAAQIEEVKDWARKIIANIIEATTTDNFEKFHNRHQNCEFEYDKILLK